MDQQQIMEHQSLPIVMQMQKGASLQHSRISDSDGHSLSESVLHANQDCFHQKWGTN